LQFGHAAAASLVSWLGFRGVKRNEQETVTAATPTEAPGYLFTRGADLYGRCVALAGRGEPPEGSASGERIHVSVPMLRRTINYRQLSAGVAYPTYYRKLFIDLRTAMTAAVVRARTTAPLWAADRTGSGAGLPEGLTDLVDSVVLMPSCSDDWPTITPTTTAIRRSPGSPRTRPSATIASRFCRPGSGPAGHRRAR
jgi:hypothetical protein